MTQMSKRTTLFTIHATLMSLLIAATISLSVFSPTKAASPTASNYRMSWVGTSSQMTGANEQWIQDFINTAVVQDDGTIWTASGWDEAHHEYGDYKNGQVVGSNLWQNNHNLNYNSARSVQDNSGRTWSIQNITFVGGDRVCRNGSSICIGPFSNFRPNALAIANDGSLMVADNGADQQIKFYNISGNSTNQVRTLGEKGGAWAGSERGRTGPLRFHGLWGTGQDNSGNIYVIGNIPGGGSWMRSLQENGTMNWQRYGKIFVSNAVPDMSTDGQWVYDHNAVYKMDYTQTTAGKEVIGDFPYAITVDPWNNPNDGRLTVKDGDNYPKDYGGSIDAHYSFTFFVPKWIRNCNGNKYMFTTTMFHGLVEVWVQNGLIWEQKSFINVPDGADNWPWASYIDTNCDIWQSTWDGYIRRYPAIGIDSSRNLTYGNVQQFAQLTDFNEVMRLQYDRTSDTLYVSGYTPARPRVTAWGDVGTAFKRYSNWSSSRNMTLNIDLPNYMAFNSDGSENGQDSRYMHDWDVVGAYVFMVFMSANDETNEHISPVAYSLNNGSRVNFRTTAPIISNDVGWVDVKGITTGLRANGEYIFFVEEDWKNKSLLFRWCPTGTCTTSGGSTSTTYEAENATLSGDASVYDCASCSNSKAVGWIGTNSSVTFTNVQASTSGNRQLTFHYATDINRTIQIKINTNSPTNVTLPSTGSWETFGTTTITVNLQSGNNTITYSCSTTDAPDLDRIVT